MNKKVFVVIVTYNGAHWINKNISSLQNSSYPVSIVVIDNNSTDNSPALLERYPIDLIKSPYNLGFGKANNIGIKKAMDAGADYIFLLNQDAWVFEDTIASLVKKMEEERSVGLLSPMHYDRTEENLDKGFKTYYSRSRGKTPNNVAIVPFVNAAAWMLSRYCVDKVGFFEPLYGHYGEDRNYCDRVSYHKFLIGIDEESRIVHDRVIKRNFNKDVVQSKYKILSAVLNINDSASKSWASGFREALGLPKYFHKFYGTRGAVKMFFTLSTYYFGLVANSGKIAQARNNAK